MSVCHSSPGRARSKRRGRCALRRRFFGAGEGSIPDERSVFRTLPELTTIPWKRARKSRTRRRPKSGKRFFVRTISARTVSESRRCDLRSSRLDPERVSSPLGPSLS